MGFALGIRYLTGYSVAATRPDGDPEWPPHPARVFMAMAAAHFENPGDPSVVSEQLFEQSVQREREVLQWLESLDQQPRIFASDKEERRTVTCYVPVNDKRDPFKITKTKTGRKVSLFPHLHSVSIGRLRNERTFPRVRPHDDRVFLVWDFDLSEEHRDALARLCSKVTRIGHSSSLVQMWLADPAEVPEPNWLPDDERPLRRLRAISPDFLKNLEELFGERGRQRYWSLKEELERLKTEKKPARGRGASQRKAQLQSQIDKLQEQLHQLPPPREPLRPTVGLWQGYGRKGSTAGCLAQCGTRG